VIDSPDRRVISSPEELRQRTKAFALRIIKLYRALPNREDARVLGRQFLRSGTAVAANYRSACRARSRADFVSKIGIALEEADETALWLELLIDADIVKRERLEDLLTEATELVRILQASRNTAKSGGAITNRKSTITNVRQSPITNHQSQMDRNHQSPFANHQ
jgi:four helix bundle protein